jgi:hypothetical protein
VSLANCVGSSIATLKFDKDGQIRIPGSTGDTVLGKYQAGKWLQITIRKVGPQFSVLLKGKQIATVNINSVKPDQVERLVFRTGNRFQMASQYSLLEGQDRQAPDPSVFLIDDIAVKTY